MVESLVRFSVDLIEVAAIVVLVSGIVLSCAAAAYRSRTGDAPDVYRSLRQWIGRSILLALELLVAADIVATVAIDPTLQSVAVLAGIVVIRTFLSLSLEVEIEGRWPWRRAQERGR